MAFRIVQDFVRKFFASSRETILETIGQVSMEILAWKFSDPHHLAEMVERGFLVLEDVGHQAFLAPQQNVVDVVLILHQRAECIVQVGINFTYFLEFVEDYDYSVLF